MTGHNPSQQVTSDGSAGNPFQMIPDSTTNAVGAMDWKTEEEKAARAKIVRLDAKIKALQPSVAA